MATHTAFIKNFNRLVNTAFSENLCFYRRTSTKGQDFFIKIPLCRERRFPSAKGMIKREIL